MIQSEWSYTSILTYVSISLRAQLCLIDLKLHVFHSFTLDPGRLRFWLFQPLGQSPREEEIFFENRSFIYHSIGILHTTLIGGCYTNTYAVLPTSTLCKDRTTESTLTIDRTEILDCTPNYMLQRSFSCNTNTWIDCTRCSLYRETGFLQAQGYPIRLLHSAWQMKAVPEILPTCVTLNHTIWSISHI